MEACDSERLERNYLGSKLDLVEDCTWRYLSLMPDQAHKLDYFYLAPEMERAFRGKQVAIVSVYLVSNGVVFQR